MIALKRSMPLAHSLTGRIVFNGKQLDAGRAGMASASKVSVPTAPTAQEGGHVRFGPEIMAWH